MRSSNSFENDRQTLKGFIEIYGNIPVLLTAPHAQSPIADLLTGEIAYRVAVETNASALISTVSRRELDYNRTECRGTPFRKRIHEIIQGFLETHSDVLLLDIHGMEKSITSFSDEITVIFGTAGGITIDVDYVDMLREELAEKGINAEDAFMTSPEYIGGDIVIHHGKPSRGVHAVQLEIAAKNRRLGERNLIEALVNFIRRWILQKQYEHELKKTQMRKILKDAGAQRISHDAPEALRDILYVELAKISVRAVSIASSSNRETIEGKDIRKAASGLLKRKGYFFFLHQ